MTGRGEGINRVYISNHDDSLYEGIYRHTVSGIVLDSNGNSVVGVKLTLSNSSESISTISNSAGFFVVGNISDRSTLTASFQGLMLANPFESDKLQGKKAIAYPNPADKAAIIAVNLEQAGNVEIRFYNINGELISKLSQEFTSSGNNYLTWNCETISSGLYIMRVWVDGSVKEVQKIAVKQLRCTRRNSVQ